ncbi:hypothetical protein RYX36_018641 [Vicia faba]
MIYTETCIVGDDKGWPFNVENWPEETTFNAGDILVFNYDPSEDNVVKFTENNYNSCNAREIVYYRSGADKVTLVKGDNYFISGDHGHFVVGEIRLMLNVVVDALEMVIVMVNEASEMVIVMVNEASPEGGLGGCSEEDNN